MNLYLYLTKRPCNDGGMDMSHGIITAKNEREARKRVPDFVPAGHKIASLRCAPAETLEKMRLNLFGPALTEAELLAHAKAPEVTRTLLRALMSAYIARQDFPAAARCREHLNVMNGPVS